jgi:hypothetical protein
VRTQVYVTARSYTYLANEIVRIFYEAVTDAGLSPSQLADRQQVIERGLRTWLTLRQLNAAYLEIWDPATSQARSRVDLNIAFEIKGRERYETDITEVKGALGRLGRVPQGCQYRVVVSLAPGAVAVEGWDEASLLDVSHLTRQDVGSVIDTQAARARMYTWS